jgi:fatty acid desaturase
VSSSIGHDEQVILNTKISRLIPVASDARGLTQVLVRYRAPNLARSIVELAITAGPLVLLWSLMWATLDLGYWLCLLLAVPAAGFLVRLFMIQHDCGHGAFFHRRCANDWVGRVIGVLTLTPYDLWRRKHAIHHSTSGNLDRRGIGDIDTLTVHEYLARSRWGRLRYRVYRHPLVMFGLGPAYLFILEHRLPNLLRWFTANIGVHHIHHLCSRIPCYRLPLVLRDHPELDGIGRLTLFQSLRCVRLVLWDEGQQRLISFREVRRHCAPI